MISFLYNFQLLRDRICIQHTFLHNFTRFFHIFFFLYFFLLFWSALPHSTIDKLYIIGYKIQNYINSKLSSFIIPFWKFSVLLI